MQELTNILCYGCSPETIEQIENALPDRMFYVVPTDCATDLIAVPCLMTIFDPRALSDEDAQMLCNFYQEFPDDLPLLLAPWPELKTSKSLVLPENPRDWKYVFLEQTCAHKKSQRTNSGMADLLKVLIRIHQQPDVTTQELADMLERSPRTVQRYITTLNLAGEMIDYDRDKHGWHLTTGHSELVEDALHEYERVFHPKKSTPTPNAAFISPLQKSYWNWDSWYQDALNTMLQLFPSPDDCYELIWYSITEKSYTLRSEMRKDQSDLIWSVP